ncbi:hypothetical protein [Geoalkalibacter sp.]|uniref:hypothetical protein n=1 Tax=Geoalkalibacter sp. TaxID=3041440 RepID=UPI00272DEAA4|nr:hypothetical protein [Geoalkalibacter sp.]
MISHPPTHAQTHWDSILMLYRQRRTLMASPDLDAAVLARTESVLRYHLHVLARCAGFEAPADQEPQAFALLASRLSSPREEVRRQGYEDAYAWLVEGGEAGQGALAALTLQPDQDASKLLDIYRDHEPLRPRLFDLWREQGWEVPRGLLHRAELQGRDEALQVAALTYAVNSPAVGMDLFQAYCRTLLDGGTPQLPGSVLVPALWGAMLRGEPQIGRMLRRAVEFEADPATRFALLRLAALRADAEILPVLRPLLQERPAQGARLLALHGSAQAVEILIEALSQAATMEVAARAWPWIAGMALPQTPRLHRVGEAGGQGLMPDAQAAHSWWQCRRSTLSPDERMLCGAPLSLPRLHDLALCKAGEAGRDILDLLALKLGRPLAISPRAEQAQRRAFLKALPQASIHQGSNN